MIKVFLPKGNLVEKKYIIEYIFSQFLLDKKLEILTTPKNYYIIQYNDFKIKIRDEFLNENNYSISNRSDNNFSYSILHYKEVNCFSFFGSNEVLENNKSIIIESDIIGSIFWMITRYEEYWGTERDTHNRFLSVHSKLENENFKLPIVDVNVLFLKKLLESFFKINVELTGEYRSIATHDIDYPFITKNISFKSLLKNVLGDLLSRKSFELGFKRFFSYVFNNKKLDPANNINWIINANNDKASHSIFFYISKSRKGALDTLCDIQDLYEMKQIKSILDADMEIGLHPSYLSSENYNYFKEEKEIINKVLSSLKAEEIISSRQHYLKFDIKNHYKNFQNLGIAHEYSLGFADYCGFRSGTCRPYKPFDIINRLTYEFVVHPLVIMDTTAYKYLKISDLDVLKLHCEFSKTIKKFKGEFIYLWHNTELMTSKRKKLYKKILESVKI